MTHEEYENWENVQYRMENEGFHYCFKHYSRFEEIQDENFHKLREMYLAAAKRLEDYVNDKVNEDIDE